jgi:hypothetical protein
MALLKGSVHKSCFTLKARRDLAEGELVTYEDVRLKFAPLMKGRKRPRKKKLKRMMESGEFYTMTIGARHGHL